MVYKNNQSTVDRRPTTVVLGFGKDLLIYPNTYHLRMDHHKPSKKPARLWSVDRGPSTDQMSMKESVVQILYFNMQFNR